MSSLSLIPNHAADQAFQRKLKTVLAACRGSAALEAAVLLKVDEFFKENPNETRTRWSEAVVTMLIMERFADAAEAAQTEVAS